MLPVYFCFYSSEPVEGNTRAEVKTKGIINKRNNMFTENSFSNSKLYSIIQQKGEYSGEKCSKTRNYAGSEDDLCKNF